MSTSSPIIRQRPIKLDQKRIDLSLEYMKMHYGIIQKEPTIVPKMIVLHYTEGGTLESNIQYFKAPYLSSRPDLTDGSNLNVSAQFIIDRDGSIYQLLPSNFFARHTIGLNYCAIGVENIGGSKNPLTAAQVNANAYLIRYLSEKYPIEYLIGHSEYFIFRNTRLWKDKNPNYYTQKFDPGEEFMQQLRAKVQDLHLKNQP
ncbi:N-acetylmuramoyl-L-alanine amidase [Elizabethkingia argenteiflava]|nr:peptidoglycan recognition family protein [Elizabethkingia argenteiflava]